MLSRLPLNFPKNSSFLTFCTRELNFSNSCPKKLLFHGFYLRNFSENVKTDSKESQSSETDKSNKDSKWMSKTDNPNRKSTLFKDKYSTPFSSNPDNEDLTEEQQLQKQEIIRELTRKLSGPLADEDGNVPIGDRRPIAIEVDGPSHFYSNTTKYTAYTKLKHRLLTRMGYKVLHVPFFEWRRLRGAREREEYMRNKLKEEPTEWLDPEDEEFYNKRMESLNKDQDEALKSLNITNN